jgi:ethanolaminephosphotransferase
MSGTASNYDVSRMTIGIALTGLSFLAVSIHMLGERGLFNIDTLLFIAILAGNGAIMFASSYVEEEQQFWYWISAGWIAYIRCRRSV